MSILNKYKKHKNIIQLIFDKYWDFVLSIDDTDEYDDDISYDNKCLSSFIDFSDKRCFENEYGVVSLPGYSYDNAKTDNIILENIGITGVDNGLIRYDNTKITNDTFKEIFYNSKLELNEWDKRFHCVFVTGNTGNYDYSYTINDEFISLNGGFLQGFYKLYGYNYEILPTSIEDEWNIEMTIRPMEYNLKDNTLNKVRPKNSGILFYLGARAENKFSLLYNKDDDFEIRDDSHNVEIVDEVECPYFSQDEENKDDEYFQSDFFLDDYNTKEENECENSVYLPEEEEYYTEDNILDDRTEELSNKGKDFEFETDNKFVYYNRTKTGLTTNDEDAVMVITGNTGERHNKTINISENGVNANTDNGFLIYNRTKTGYTTNDEIVSDGSSISDSYDVFSDIVDNSFCIIRNDDGSIGYRYIVKDCDNKYKTYEEYGIYNVLPIGEWHTVTIKFKVMGGTFDACGNKLDRNKMRIFIYVDGYLKFVSKELPEFNFKPLDDDKKKQEGVPFNLSIGGGSQGLMESILFDYKKINDKILPIEENFAGTFIGDIKDFKFYTCSLNLRELRI